MLEPTNLQIYYYLWDSHTWLEILSKCYPFTSHIVSLHSSHFIWTHQWIFFHFSDKSFLFHATTLSAFGMLVTSSLQLVCFSLTILNIVQIQERRTKCGNESHLVFHLSFNCKKIHHRHHQLLWMAPCAIFLHKTHPPLRKNAIC